MPERQFGHSAQIGVDALEYDEVLATAYRLLNEGLDQKIRDAGYEPIGEHVNMRSDPYVWGDGAWVTITSQRDGRNG